MIKDRFDEMYLLLNGAKNLDKKGNVEAAKKSYIKVVENYRVNTDYAYKRLCAIYLAKNDYKSVIYYAKKAIEAIEAEDFVSDKKYFDSLIAKSELENEIRDKEQKTTRNKKFKYSYLFYVSAAIFLSLPDRFMKFIFILFFFLSLDLSYGIIKLLLRHKIKEIEKILKIRTVFFIIFLISTIVFALQMPRADWSEFFKNVDLSKISEKTESKKQNKSKEIIEKGNAKEKSQKSREKISKSDLEKLKAFSNLESELIDYNIFIEGSNISLEIIVSDSLKKEKIKNITFNLLNELNSIKSFEKPADNKLGEVYQNYSLSILAKTKSNQKLLSGIKKKSANKIIWK